MAPLSGDVASVLAGSIGSTVLYGVIGVGRWLPGGAADALGRVATPRGGPCRCGGERPLWWAYVVGAAVVGTRFRRGRRHLSTADRIRGVAADRAARSIARFRPCSERPERAAP